MKWVARLESGHTPDNGKVDAYWKDGDTPWVSLIDTGHLKNQDYINDTEYYTNEYRAESLVGPSASATVGHLGRETQRLASVPDAPKESITHVSQHFIAWICSERRAFAEYLLRPKSLVRMQGELERLTMGATHANDRDARSEDPYDTGATGS